MKTTVYFRDFVQAFDDVGRGAQFSTEGLRVLFDYLEELEQDCGEEWELDVIALCCDFAEASALEIRESYGLDADANVEDYLIDEGYFVGKTENGFVYRQH